MGKNIKRGTKRLFSVGFRSCRTSIKKFFNRIDQYPRPRVLACILLLGFLISFIPTLYFGIPQKKAAAAGTVAFGGATTANNDQGNSVTINKPSVTATNDLLVAVVMIQGRNPTITLPSGWNNFPTTVKFTINGTTTTTMAAYYKIATGSEPASYTFQETSGPNTRWVGAISAYKGVDTTTPIEAQSTTNTGTGTAVAANAVTSTSANARIVSVFGVEYDSTATFTPPTTAKERYDHGSARSGVGNTDVSISSADITQYAAGGGNGKTATASNADNFGAFQYALKPDGVIRMFLFWDGGAAPSGWSLIDDYDGRYPRGEDPSNFGATGGTSSHTPTTTGAGMGYVNGGGSNNLSSGNNNVFPASQGHGHGSYAGGTFGGTPASASHEPASRTLKLIRYDSGVPNIIPNGAIALFDDSPNTVPTGWTALSGTTDPFYQKVIKLDPTVNTNSGSDTHQHSVTWMSLVASNGTTEGANPLFVNGTPAANAHTHTAPATSSTPAVNHLPPYVGPRLAKAGVDTETISIGITGMFDGDPGGGWVVRSRSSGLSSETIYYQKFLRATDVFNGAGGQGSATHSHANFTSGNSGTNVGALGNNSNLNLSIPPAISGNGHAHTITLSFAAGDTSLPPYFNIVIAEKVNFILQAFWWYNDNDALTPTDRWGNPDLAVNSGIIALPLVTSDPPDLTRELRLRLQILINGNNLAANVVRYKLQYNASLTGSCTTATGTWVDVGESSDNAAAWRFATSGVTGETSLASSVFSPASSVLGRYVKSNTGSNNNPAANIGDTLEYDYHIQHNAAAGGTMYSFRIIESTGTLLSQYDACPTLITYPRTENQMRHGNFFTGGAGTPGSGVNIEQGYSWNN